jgi:hypothetical protein
VAGAAGRCGRPPLPGEWVAGADEWMEAVINRCKDGTEETGGLAVTSL